MADAFDPYHKWLGILPKDQPPNHYRLLAIELFESDPDVIEAAADRQMSHLRSYQTGKHSAESQKLLNECAAARVALLNPQKKADYDAQLRKKLAQTVPLAQAVPQASAVVGASVPPRVARALPVAQPGPFIDVGASSPVGRLSANRRKKKPAWLIPTAGVGGAVALALVMWIASRPNGPSIVTDRKPRTVAVSSPKTTVADSSGKRSATTQVKAIPSPASVTPPTPPALAGSGRATAGKSTISGGTGTAPGDADSNRRDNGETLDVVLAPGVTMRLVKIPANEDGKTKPFYLGETEVTQKQWVAVMGNTPFSHRGDDLPVANVDGQRCLAFCEKLGQSMVRFHFRPPTEDEWAHAFGASEQYGPDFDKTAWSNQNSGEISHPVGRLRPNAFGLYDMLGNIRERVGDASVTLGTDASCGPNDGRFGRQEVGLISELDNTGFRVAADLPEAAKPPALPDLVDNKVTPAAKRLPVPSGKELAAAQKKVEELFAAKWKAANDLAARLAIARNMFDTAVRTPDDAALRYALLREANRTAAALGDVGTPCDAVEEVGRMFDIDALAEKLAAVSTASEHIQAPAQIGNVALASLLLADRAAGEARFDEARKFAALATVAGRRTRIKALLTAAEQAASRSRARQARHSRLRAAMERLGEPPGDASVNLAAGLDLCLFEGDWKRGLPLLARSGDERWVQIAKLEEQAGKEPAQRTALIDAWLAVAEKQPTALRVECQLQAKYWLERGVPPDTLNEARQPVLKKLAALPRMSQARLVPGLDRAMFNGGDFQEFRARDVDERICHRFGFGSPHPSVPGDYFSVRWTGWLKPPVAGKYVLQTSNDDSIRIRLNGKLMIDHWNRGAGGETAEVELTDDLQPLVVEYNDYTDNADVCLRWALKDISEFQVVPPEAYFHDPAVAP